MSQKRNSFYTTNQPPLIAQPYTALPIGAIHPKGMLLEILKRQSDGLTGHLDSIYSLVCGDNNGWLGGTGDGWERGPYWLDGLVPLAYILDDDDLKLKAQKWIEWSINNQQENGYFGPRPLPENYENIPGTQQGRRMDWWPKMVMLKVLQQYYSATGDKRIIKLMSDYFRYQLKMLPENELGYLSYWGERRGGDNLAVVYWLYNITHEPFLLDLAKLIHRQTHDWTSVYSGNMIRTLNPLPDLHCVNVAQALKEPVVYFQQNPDPKFLKAVKDGLSALKDCHGFVNGMYGGDERLHGNDPTQGSELCSAVEMMFSFENILPITGDVYYADYLEKIAYNVLPTQISDDYMNKQYFQQVNQVLITDTKRNFFNDQNARICFGTTSGYPCCLTNMHQGWPKFVQNLWYATAENGVAALVYGSSEVVAKVGQGQEVKIIESTDYPFKEKINFELKVKEKVHFGFHLRIPGWCRNPDISVNGNHIDFKVDNGIVIINREWEDGDRVDLFLPAEFRFSNWYENSVGIERGPLVYALKIEEEWQERNIEGGVDTFWEVLPKSPWNYGLDKSLIEENRLEIEIADQISSYPWNINNAPIHVRIMARRIPFWGLERNSAAKIPVIPRYQYNGDLPLEQIELIPYGCSTLRIAQFPVCEN